MSKALCVRLSPAAIGVFAFAAIFATCEAQKRGGGTGTTGVSPVATVANGHAVSTGGTPVVPVVQSPAKGGMPVVPVQRAGRPCTDMMACIENAKPVLKQAEFTDYVGESYFLSVHDLMTRGGITYLPLYMTPLLPGGAVAGEKRDVKD